MSTLAVTSPITQLPKCADVIAPSLYKSRNVRAKGLPEEPPGVQPTNGAGTPEPPPAVLPVAIDPPDGALIPEAPPADIKNDVRRGCLLYFSIAALLVIGLCALLVWVSRVYNKSHPPAPAQPEPEQVEQRH